MDSVMDEGDMLSRLAAAAIFPASAAAMKYLICRNVISMAETIPKAVIVVNRDKAFDIGKTEI